MAIKTTKNAKAVAAKANAAPVVNVVPPTSEEINLLISQRAYELFLQRGASYGNEVSDWLLAEQEILGALCTPAPAPVIESTPLISEPVVEKAPAKAKRTVRPKTAAVTATAKRSTASTRTRRKSTPETPKG